MGFNRLLLFESQGKLAKAAVSTLYILYNVNEYLSYHRKH